MFQQLEALVRASGKLQLTLKMDSDRMAVVVVPSGEGKEAALRQPLILSGTPAELDEGFIEAIRSYSAAHASLSEQVSVTAAILQEAEKSLSSKAQKALKGPKAPAKEATGPVEGDDDDDDADDTRSEASAPSTTPEPAAENSSGTDLFALIS
ncbi:PRTRC system protein E [Paraburkholderia sp. BL10I2N1]|uniref:PRTRC system protein E n=1 Tax=Paraburkholderia sp. BL10I2N1 TaxID=1938796 RepID=UPI00105E9CF1|nr:PRTRC system protein E [Paraburkholderia sp. BL10I2N1]TDN59056.1 PRTRC genetic system protein E [Paraburkholderia sp. BL10I2N1]